MVTRVTRVTRVTKVGNGKKGNLVQVFVTSTLLFVIFVEEEKPDATDAPVTSLPVSSPLPTASSGLDVHTITSTKTINYRLVNF